MRPASSVFVRAGVLCCAAVFLTTATTGAPALAGAARKAPTIDTFKDWNGNDFILPFGCPNTTTYGQVIKIPHHKSRLQKFRFAWANYAGSRGSMVVRAEVYAWTDRRATGPALWESPPLAVSFGDDSFHKVTFKPGGISVTPGARYVIFASLDKDYEQCTGEYELKWASVSNDAYSRGTFFYQNNGGDESHWTAHKWVAYGIDLAFSAYVSN